MTESKPAPSGRASAVLLGLALFFAISLGGDAVTTALGIPFPGAVLGLLFVLTLMCTPAGARLERVLAPAADILVPLLPLLLVPLAVGAMGLFDVLGRQPWQIICVLFAGWLIAALVTACTMLVMRRRTSDA